MGHLTMLLAAFTMVGGHHDQRALQLTELVELAQHGTQALVGIGDLSLVGIVGEKLAIGRRGDVRFVGVPIVQPGEERLAVTLPQPRQNRVVDMAGGAFVVPGGETPLHRLAAKIAARCLQVVVIEIEALSGSKLPGEREAADRGGRRIALRLQQLRQSLARLRQVEERVVAHPVDHRIDTREDRRVCRLSHRVRRVSMLEEETLSRQPIEVRRPRRILAVTADEIRPSRIKREEQHIQRPPTAGRQAESQNQESDECSSLHRATGSGETRA